MTAGQRWNKEKPTEPGWYWMRAPKCGWRDCVVWVDKDEDGFYIDVGDCDSEYVMDIEAEWLGPITPDSYQQGRVAGLREASRKASDAVPLLFGTHPNFANYIADALMDFSDILNEDADKLAQAAQDEKGVGDGNIKMS